MTINDSPVAEQVRHRNPWRRRVIFIPVVLLLIVGALIYTAASPEGHPSVPLGASAAIPGGLARVNGIISLDPGGESFPDRPGNPDPFSGDGVHQVRVMLELTSLESGGVEFTAADYHVVGAGTARYDVTWTAVESASLEQGETLTAALVFELPDRAVLLTLENDDGVRLSLGTAHHSGAP